MVIRVQIYRHSALQCAEATIARETLAFDDAAQVAFEITAASAPFAPTVKRKTGLRPDGQITRVQLLCTIRRHTGGRAVSDLRKCNG